MSYPRTTDDLDIQATNVVRVLIDPSCEMAAVHLNNQEVLKGNFGDFYPGCYGQDFGEDFRGHGHLASLLWRCCAAQEGTCVVECLPATCDEATCEMVVIAAEV